MAIEVSVEVRSASTAALAGSDPMNLYAPGAPRRMEARAYSESETRLGHAHRHTAASFIATMIRDAV
jgi:hypothetical protein